jgi:hypothetical protein
MVELEHLDETCKEVVKWIGTRQWNTTLCVQQNHKIKTFSMGDTILLFPRVERNTPKSSKNHGLVRIRYKIVSSMIIHHLSTLTNLNQIPFWSTSSNLINVWEKLLKDKKLQSKGEESTWRIQKTRMHKKVFGMVLPKIRLHQKLKSIKNI